MSIKITGLTLVHNGIEGGYPFVEVVKAMLPWVDYMVAVDMSSTDDTADILKRLGCRLVLSPWSGAEFQGDNVLGEAFARGLNYCEDAVIFAEGDEVFSNELLSYLVTQIDLYGVRSRAVWRLQVEQNFQRCRWYPHPVVRSFAPEGFNYVPSHLGELQGAEVMPQEAGYLWDCAACFRDNWHTRRRNQSDLWNEPRPLRVGLHFTYPNSYTDEAAFLAEPQWTWTQTPFAIPDVLRPCVGMTKYEARL